MKERLTWLIGAILMWMVILIARPLFFAVSFILRAGASTHRNFKETMRTRRMTRREV